MSDGKRRVTSIAEITGMEGDIVQMQEIYKFVRTGTDADGTVQGHFQATGVRPRFLADLAMGIKIPGSLFRSVAAAVTPCQFDFEPDLSVLSAVGVSRDVCRRRLSAVLQHAPPIARTSTAGCKLLNDQPDRESVLVQLRRERGLTSGGDYRLPLINVQPADAAIGADARHRQARWSSSSSALFAFVGV